MCDLTLSIPQCCGAKGLGTGLWYCWEIVGPFSYGAQEKKGRFLGHAFVENSGTVDFSLFLHGSHHGYLCITHHMLPNTVFSQDRDRRCMRIKRSANATNQGKHKLSPGPLSKHNPEVDDLLQEPLAGVVKRRGDSGVCGASGSL